MYEAWQALWYLASAATRSLLTAPVVRNDLVAAERDTTELAMPHTSAKLICSMLASMKGDKLFKQLAEDISADLNGGKAFDMTILLDRYNHFLRGLGVAVDRHYPASQTSTKETLWR